MSDEQRTAQGQVWSDDDIDKVTLHDLRGDGLITFFQAKRLMRQVRDEYEAEIAQLRARLAATQNGIDRIMGYNTTHLDGLNEVQLERYAQLSPPEMFRQLLDREAQLAASWEPVPDGVYMEGALLVKRVHSKGIVTVATRAMRADGTGYWSGSSLPTDMDIMRRKPSEVTP